MALTNVWLAGYGGPAIGATAVWIAPNDGTVPSAAQVTLVGWNGPVSGATPIWIAGYGGPPPVAVGAIPICIKGWSGSGGGSDGGPTSVWSAADATANGMTLTNGGLTVTPSGAGTWQTIRSSISKTTGNLYVEFAVDASISSQFVFLGVGSAGMNIANYLGASTYSAGMLSTENDVSAGFTSNQTVSWTFHPNDVFALAVNFTTGNIWLAQNNVWLGGGNPAMTRSLPIISFTPATVGALFAGLSFHATGGGVWTLQSTAASQKYTPPSGFAAWDGGVAPPPTSVWSASDAAANGMTLSNGGLTVTPQQTGSGWHTLRSSISRSSGKLYAEFAADATAAYEYQLFGLASSSINLATNLGGSNYSAGTWPSNTNYVSSGFTNNAVPGSVSVGPNIVIGIAVDFAAGKVWFSHNNIWYNASDPVAGSGPIFSFVPATVGALFLGMSFDGVAGATNGVWTLQPTAASQTYAPPAGFSPWG